MRSEPAAVTVLGLGSMGTALAGALLKGGHATTVWNRSPHKAKPLAERGATVAATPEEAVAASPLLIACVLDYAALHTVLDPVADSLAGKTLVNLTSGSPEQAAEAAAWARAHGAHYLDGAIMTTPPGVGSPEMMFLYSGERTVFDTHRPVLASLGDPLHLGTDPGLASLYDAALLGLMWAAMTGWLHGTALVGAEGTPATAFTPVAIRWLSAVTGFLTTYAPQVDAGHYPGDDATVDVQIAAIDHLIHAAAARGVDNALPELLKATMERTRAAGHGSSSYASVIETLRKAAGNR
ncbi:MULTISPECIES: NAD(P)-dependent oxidoreductase [Streptomyces]|uniref:NAD(P)-dependent oxidoreductase n=2 Tax=Streptomyces rimosus subsp. rimosus TaxID=132474 RepID=L8EFV5_STRR1|nr:MULTISPECIES: NAD(P)-binding domain-containing protein [Streptomyces]AUD39509.1 WHU imine reductase 24 [synthetic construct]KOG71384.1 6-phosphogluconate dehydrogenase [Kitasatospora aureofaciens]MYT46925.1 NAD(P)-binding domain-containing protein [Streptomyces sp. SID5471]KEF09008.1 6-phosphogluconate dehydrogenase [Streptomyces rimosus]KEF16085.1 6-phosphogluconate dehydrogenase [Streptomyces rimosus]